MGQPVIQTSFNAGEWAPSLYARVDLQKYHSGASLLENFFVDYRGGATIRAGTKYILQCFKSATQVRLIPFQASFTVSYVLEFGDQYLRFHNNGAPVLENPTTISAINIGTSTITDTAHGYANGDWVLLNNIVGTVGQQLNGNYYIIAGATTNTYTLTDLNGTAIVLTGAYTSGGTAQRVYTIASPFLATELSLVKFTQNVNQMILCHPNHPPQQLILTTATNWSLTSIIFGPTIQPPATPTVTSTLTSGTTIGYAYVVTSVDGNGQESGPSAFGTIGLTSDIRSVGGTNTVTWTAVTGAVSYNVYRANPRYGAGVPTGSLFGFVGNVTQTTFFDSNVVPDFSQPAPVPQSPFSGSGVQSITLTNQGGAVPVVPGISLTAAPPGGTNATASLLLKPLTVVVDSGGTNWSVGDGISIPGLGMVLQVLTVTHPFGAVLTAQVNQFTAIGGSAGSALPTNPQPGVSFNGVGTGASFDFTWGVASITLTNPGTGYLSTPTISFTVGTAAATATIGAPAAGNPSVPAFAQQRLVLAGPIASPQQFNMSQPGAYYNFNTTVPAQPDNAIQDVLVSGQLNTIKSMIPQPQGLIMLSDKQAWLLNGGSPGAAFDATALVANPQAYSGASDVPPIVATDNILYVQSKGSIVRDLVFNFYTQVYTGTDISVLSSHLFYGFQVLEWAWAEEPFKLVWAVRNDGTMLNLTFLKEQELIAWAHSTTQGQFKSVATVVESTVTAGNVDAVYTVVQRVINGHTVQYVERVTEINYVNGLDSAWAVDAGISFFGAASLNFSGAQHLANTPVVGIATDNLGNTSAITPLTMGANGSFTLPAPTNGATGYTHVVVGLAYTPTLQTLPLDLGEPTVQGKRKKIAGVTVRVKDCLGLNMGRSAATAVPMADLIVGNVGSMTNQLVTNLVTGDARGYSDPQWDVPGQYVIQQPLPYPGTVLGVIPEIEIGDTAK
jgi:hypothetical protein